MTELYREEGHQGVEIVVPLEVEMEGSGERNLLFLDCLDIDLLEQAIVGNNALVVNTVDEWLRNCHFSYAGHIKTIDIIPPVDFIILVE